MPSAIKPLLARAEKKIVIEATSIPNEIETISSTMMPMNDHRSKSIPAKIVGISRSPAIARTAAALAINLPKTICAFVIGATNSKSHVRFSRSPAIA